MGVTERFLAYANDFEATFEDDDWSRLEPHFADDVVYAVENVFFGCRVEGTQAVLAALRKSIDGFDRRAASREIEVTGGPDVDGNTMTISWVVHYQFDGVEPVFDLIGQTRVVVEEDRITELADRYPDGFSEGAQAFLSEHVPELDPSYA